MTHLIITHEQADFDALASLTAARILDPNAYARLPRRVNRNVQAFLTLYGEDLPLEESEDLPRGKVERLTMVDTQTPPAIRGVDKQTHVHIIDHHPLNRSLPDGWTAAIEPVGATTTLLVETLQASPRPLSLSETTLLLLGIYEDTGSLSYAGTTARDARAAAWLLDHGASLSLAAGFLNHPLSDGQRMLYDRLHDHAEMHEINGQRIMLAKAEAPSEVEEISTLAHKLRDAYDPDGLLVLVKMGANIQMVARSTTDLINVADLAARFGGGGHSRAAAALIRGKTLDEASAQLLAELPKSITTPMQVSQIFSPRPQVVETVLTIAEASDRMTRYGYEGFPVVRSGKVAGLLTRRSVDRALGHGMHGATVESIMEAGDYTVLPSDSVPNLQRLMVDCGWGQIPVVSPDGGQVIGIVTRTDLLKALTPNPFAGNLNLRERLTTCFPPARLALLQAVASAADDRRMPIYLVGGVVRDLILEIPSFDLDLVVEGDAIALAREVSRRFGGRVRGHERFGTAKWLLQGLQISQLHIEPGQTRELPESLDLVSARAEFYAHPSALPEVERGNLKLDLHRRDFTINTLALSLNASQFGNVHDYWGGLRDLKEKRIRVLHSISFVDDPTRILRAARLEQRLGFRIGNRTRDLIVHALPLLHRVSGDRIRHELEAAFDEPEPCKTLARLQDLGVFHQLSPGLNWRPGCENRILEARSLHPESRWNLTLSVKNGFFPICAWLMEFPEAALDGILTRLNFPHHDAERIRKARSIQSTLYALPENASPSAVTAVCEEAPVESLIAVWLASSALLRAWIDHFLRDWRNVKPAADGDTLRKLGLPPGPAFRMILGQLRAAYLDGIIHNQEEETQFLKRILKTGASTRGDE